MTFGLLEVFTHRAVCISVFAVFYQYVLFFILFFFITAHLKIALCKSPFDLSAPSIPNSCWITELLPYLNDLCHTLMILSTICDVSMLIHKPWEHRYQQTTSSLIIATTKNES